MNSEASQNPDWIQHRVDWEPLIPLSSDWQFFALFAFFLLGTFLVGFISFRDTNNQPWGVVTSLFVIRMVLLLVGVFAACNFIRKREQILVEPSTIAIILDASVSMSLEGSSDAMKRFDRAVAWVHRQKEFSHFRNTHDVVFYVLGETPDLKEFGRLKRTGKPKSDRQISTVNFAFPFLIAVVSGVLIFGTVFSRKQDRAFSFLLLGGVLGLVVTAVWTSVSFVRDTSLQIPGQTPEQNVLSTKQNDRTSPEVSSDSGITKKVTVKQIHSNLESVLPSGVRTPLVASLNRLLDNTQSRSLAAIVILSDGIDSDRGDFSSIAKKAREQLIPLFPVGIGSSASGNNLAINYLNAPSKVNLGNVFTISGSVGLETSDQKGTIELVLMMSKTEDEKTDEPYIEEARKTLEFENEGQLPFQFDVKKNISGNYRYQVIVNCKTKETNLDDNRAFGNVQIVDRKTRILLFSGGPGRDFRFLRNQLFRDPNVHVDVFLQSSAPGAYQEADQLLFEFPQKPEDFFQYDCLIAFDPDWSELTENQTKMVRQWVAEQSGGMITVAGPVNTPKWTGRAVNDPITSPIRKIYPVSFFNQISGPIKLGRFGGEKAFPLVFTQGAESHDFFMFSENPSENRRIWQNIQVYGFYAVSESKAGAEVLARFSDPLTSYGGKQPIYFASHLYGSGRVFFQASGELWRTRGLDPEFFEQYYSRLIQWSSQGRLLRGESALELRLDRKTCLVGDTVTMRATVNRIGSELQALEQIPVSWFKNETGKSQPASPETKREFYLARVSTENTVLAFESRIKIDAAGRHIFKITAPDSENEIVEIDLFARIPNVELNQVARNERDLRVLAEQSKGKYISAEDSSDLSEAVSWIDSITDHSVQTIVALKNEKSFKQKLNFCLFVSFSLFLITNWLIRRLNRLA